MRVSWSRLPRTSVQVLAVVRLQWVPSQLRQQCKWMPPVSRVPRPKWLPVTQTQPAQGELTPSSHGPWSHNSPRPSLRGPWSHPRAESSGDIRVTQAQRNRSTSSWDQWSSSEWASSSDFGSGWKKQSRGGVRPAAWSSASPAPTDWSSWNARSGAQSWGTAGSGANPAKQSPYSTSTAQPRGRSPPGSGANPAKEGGPAHQAWTPTLRPSSRGT